MIGPARSIDANAWRQAIDALDSGRRTLVALWGGPSVVRLATYEAGEAEILALACPSGSFPSVGARHAAAIRFERTVADLWGLQAIGAPDTRPWLDHDRWPIRHPLGAAAAPVPGPSPYAFLRSEGESLHQIPVGPVHAGIIEPGHFRLTAAGETVVRLEARLGYVHRGVLGLLRGADLGRAARLAGRLSGDSTVAYGIAFARAIEAALGVDVPPRAHWLRGLMAELERLANHIGDIGAICNDAAFSLMHAHTGALRERVLRACDDAFGHRLMMDQAIPGGVAADLHPDGAVAIGGAIKAVSEKLPRLVGLYDDTASLQDRTVGTGVLKPELAMRFGAGGYVGRASGRAFDTRKSLPYPPYDALAFETPMREDGDVNARVWIRIEEAQQSLALIDQMLDRRPDGPIAVDVPAGAGEGGAMVEGFRGDVFAWVKLADGRIDEAFLRDPSWFQWPLLEAAIEGAIVADFPLCNKSFNCSYAGVDL